MKRILCVLIITSILIGTINIAVCADIIILNDYSENKISSDLYEKMQSVKKLKVCIWYSDINYDIVEKNIKKKLGFTKRDLEFNSPNLSPNEFDSLIEANKNPYESSAISNGILSDYLEENGETIKLEQLATNAYISNERSIAKAMYMEASNQIMQKHSINDNDIIFNSRYAPMIIAELSPDDIIALSQDSDVLSIEYFDDVSLVSNDESYEYDYSWGDIDTYMSTTGIVKLRNASKLTGKNVRVGMVEGGGIAPHEDLAEARFINVTVSDFDRHATNTARILAGAKGVATNALLFNYPITDLFASNQCMNAIESLLDDNVQVINLSMSFPMKDYSNETEYSEIERWIDHIAKMHNVLVVAAVGNTGNNSEHTGIIHQFGKAYNILTVGAYDNKETSNISDDVLYAYSSYDELGGCKKPDIVAGANLLAGGTSSAAPVVTGTVALMLELKPSLAAYPEAIKAILMASCQYKAKPANGNAELMSSGLTDKQGAGVFNPYLALCITAAGNYETAVLKCSPETIEQNILFYQPEYSASGMNISLAWIKNNTVNSCKGGAINNKDIADLDLYLYKNDSNNVLAKSINTTSSTEMLYYTGLDKNNFGYKICIRCFDYAKNDEIRYAYAWCTNNERYQNVGEGNGAYYLKNIYTNKYLTLNQNTSDYRLSPFSGSHNQIFLVNRDEYSNTFVIKNAFENKSGLSYGNNLILRSDDDISELKFIKAASGDLSIHLSISSRYCLKEINETTLTWNSNISSDKGSELWRLEKISYKLGDIDTNYIIDTEDSILILQAASKQITLNNMQNFLADVDNDGSVTVSDAQEILKIIAKLDD